MKTIDYEMLMNSVAGGKEKNQISVSVTMTRTFTHV